MLVDAFASVRLHVYRAFDRFAQHVIGHSFHFFRNIVLVLVKSEIACLFRKIAFNRLLQVFAVPCAIYQSVKNPFSVFF